MAKNIDFMGAIFPDVPSVKLPQQGGGLVSFDDTTDATATADKILSGYTAYANGQKLVGTASGGITPSGTISITQNGQVDVTNYATADVNVSGGGASNIVTGSFKFSGTTAHAENITLDYNGNGYPIKAIVCVKGNVGENTDYASLVRRYAECIYVFQKDYPSTSPGWNGSGDADSASAIYYFKSSSSNATSYNVGYGIIRPYIDSNASSNSSHLQILRFKNSKTMSVWISATGTSGYGFPAGIEYEYLISYSS